MWKKGWRVKEGGERGREDIVCVVVWDQKQFLSLIPRPKDEEEKGLGMRLVGTSNSVCTWKTS